MGMKFLELRFSQHSKKYENFIFLTLMVGQKTLSHLLLIGLGRFRILGWGQGLEYWCGQGGGQSPSRHMMSLRHRCDVTTSHRRHFDVMCLLGF